MTNSAEGVIQREHPTATDYYVWSFPGSPIRISISLDTIRQLRQCFADAIEAGAEACGLLYGTPGRGRVEITGVVPLSRDADSHRFFPPGAARDRLRATIQSVNAASAVVSVVGYYRGVTGGKIRLSPEALDLSHDCFADAGNVFLVMSQTGSGPVAGFFFWDCGSIFTEATFMQFPLDEQLLASPKQESRPVRLPQFALERSESEAPAAVASPSGRPVRSLSVRLLVGCFLVIACSVAAFVFAPSRSRPASPVIRRVAVSPMSLSASRLNGAVAITWDAQIPMVSSARIGLLTIKDGDSKTDVPLTKAQLQLSRLVYTPRTERMEITIEVFSPAGEATSESIILALPDLPESEHALGGRPSTPAKPRSPAKPQNLGTLKQFAEPSPPPEQVDEPRPHEVPPPAQIEQLATESTAAPA